MNSRSRDPFAPGPDPGRLQIVDVSADGVACLALAGEVDLATAPQLPVTVREALRRGQRQICLDLRAVSFMDSTGLAALLHCQRSVARHDGRLAVVQAGGEVQRVLTLSRLEQAFDLYESRDAALAALASGDGPAKR